MAQNLHLPAATSWRAMNNNELTVSDLSQLIAAREETRAELQLLSLEAWEHWRDIEARLQALEDRLCHRPSDQRGSGVHPIAATCPPEAGERSGTTTNDP
jgi:hypothetical protein